MSTTEADAALAEAKRLTRLQREERGVIPWPTLEGKPGKAPGPYVPTPEREARAARIIALRRQAAPEIRRPGS